MAQKTQMQAAPARAFDGPDEGPEQAFGFLGRGLLPALAEPVAGGFAAGRRRTICV